MSDLSKKTLDQIETGNIRPYSIWRFRALKMLVWSMFVLSILTGSIGTAVAIFLVKNADWDLYRHFGHSLAEFSLLILPWFWILFICMFTLFAYYYFRKTGRGYKLNTIRVIFLSISLSVAIGTVLSLTTLPEKIESTFNKTLPWYTHMHRHRHTMWMNPEKGFLVGTIGQSTDTIIIITDLNGNTWQVDVSKTIWRGRRYGRPNARQYDRRLVAVQLTLTKECASRPAH